ncbi:MAG: phage holin family protein [Candidatus Doudnabacteria bacterium]|nr:phage holin family protein [Candidatus Doudnabacteria bacterium]
MHMLLRWLISALVILAVSYLLPGIHVDGLFAALITALVLGLINAIIKPVVILLTLPINLITLGLFTFVINAALVMLAAKIVDGFSVDGFLWALAFSLIISLTNSLIHRKEI